MKWKPRRLNDIVARGIICPHPGWTKEEVLEWARMMHDEGETMRKFIIKEGLKSLRRK